MLVAAVWYGWYGIVAWSVLVVAAAMGMRPVHGNQQVLPRVQARTRNRSDTLQLQMQTPTVTALLSKQAKVTMGLGHESSNMIGLCCGHSIYTHKSFKVAATLENMVIAKLEDSTDRST